MSKTKPILYLVRAAPGFGKSTFVKSMFPGTASFENDMYFMHSGKYEYDRRLMPKAIEWCFGCVEKTLSFETDVVVSNTFTKKRFVDSYRNLAEKHGANFKVFRMMHDFNNNIHFVPDDVLASMKENFDDYEGETFVYPNLNQDEDDPGYRPYLFTDKKIGDKIIVSRFKRDSNRDDQYVVNKFEMEYCIATVTDIRQGTYDYLNVSYVEDDTKFEGMCMSGDCRKYS